MRNFGLGVPVIVTRPDGTEVEYESQSEAARTENLHQSPISEMCRGVKKTYRGYTARFKGPVGSKSAPVSTDVGSP